MDENNVVLLKLFQPMLLLDSNAVLKEEPAKTEPTKAESAIAEIEKLKASPSRKQSSR